MNSIERFKKEGKKNFQEIPITQENHLFVLNISIMIIKKQLTLTLEQFPEQFSLEELIDKLILLDKIERGNIQSEKNEVIKEEELENEMQKWFK